METVKTNCNHNCGECFACASKTDIKQRFTTYHFNGLTVSTGNGKIGETVNYSLDNRYCNPNWACYQYCYAKAYCEFRPSCERAYNRNADLLENDPDTFWAGVEKAFQLAALLGTGLRIHVDGEIPRGENGKKYFGNIQRLARKYPQVIVILMTKQYDAVNNWISENGGFDALAKNCIPAFSACPGLEMPNPYNLPVAGFIPKGETAKDATRICPNQMAKKLNKENKKKGVVTNIKWTCADCIKHGIKCAAGKNRDFMQD